MTPDEVRAALAAPFKPDEVGWKPQAVKNNRALAVAYIDARTVEDRLDDVFGVGGWQDEYVPLPDGNVMCKLSCRVGAEWVTKCDVGGESDQPDAGDKTKAAFSDALKRAAVKYGIGRYLYELPKQWCDYDTVKKQFVRTPELPAKFLPKGQPRPARQSQQQPQQPPPQQPPAKPTKVEIGTLADLASVLDGQPAPKDGAKLGEWAGRVEEKLLELLPGEYERSDLEAAVAEALTLGDQWQWAGLSPQQVTAGWHVLVRYVTGAARQPAAAR